MVKAAGSPAVGGAAGSKLTSEGCLCRRLRLVLTPNKKPRAEESRSALISCIYPLLALGAIIHPTTFNENRLAMRSGLATLEVLEREHLGGRAAAAGAELRGRLRQGPVVVSNPHWR